MKQCNTVPPKKLNGTDPSVSIFDPDLAQECKIQNSNQATATTAESKPELGEIYIHADGKKVRKDPIALALLAQYAGKQPTTDTFEDLIKQLQTEKAVVSTSQLDGKQETAAKPAAGATGAAPGGLKQLSKDGAEYDIYVRPDGKKVRRIKKSPVSGSATVAGGELGEVFIRADGKSVRRVKRCSVTGGATGGTQDDLGAFLNKGGKVKTGPATVHGDMVQKPVEGEIYIRVDGGKIPKGGSATVTGVILSNQKKLEKQLASASIAIVEDISFEEAKEKVEQITKRMNEIGGSDVKHEDIQEQTRLREEYFKLEREMEYFNTALILTDEYQRGQERIEKEWEETNEPGNIEALKKLRRHMPVKIRHCSEAMLTNTPSPNGKFLPKSIVKKFKRTNVLMLIRLDPTDIERMHPSTLENMRVTGLTLTERRALYAHLKVLGPKWNKNKAEKMTERKWTWFNMMKNNFKENLASYLRHIEQYGPPGNHPYATRANPNQGCPLIGKQCPLKADMMIDYSEDYGYPDGPEYEVSGVRKADADDPGAKAMQEAAELAKAKKANERADLLKKHYKGVLNVAKANGSCEAMDESMDKMEFHQLNWVETQISNKNPSDDEKKKIVVRITEALNELKLAVLDFAQRSGMQTSGKKKKGGGSPDVRSSVECGLAEEVHECSQVFFNYVKVRMDELKVKDTRIQKTIELLEGILTELHERNEATLKKLGVPQPKRSRPLKTTEDFKKEIEEKKKVKKKRLIKL